MFNKLKTPDTEEYKELKGLILSPMFSWHVNDQATAFLDPTKGYSDLWFYSHSFLHGPNHPDNPRPDHNKYPKVNSNYMDLMDIVVDQIFELNRVRCHCIYRINANSVYPQMKGGILTQPHVDHQFPHKNLLVYLTDSGVDTICFDDEGKKHHYTPSEDDIVEILKDLNEIKIDDLNFAIRQIDGKNLNSEQVASFRLDLDTKENSYEDYRATIIGNPLSLSLIHI